MPAHVPASKNLKHHRALKTLLIAVMLVMCLTLTCTPATANKPIVNHLIMKFALIHAADKTITNSLGMKFVLIPAGSFMMGSTDADLAQIRRDFTIATRKDLQSKAESIFKNEQPAHLVRISKPFYMQATEVTNDQFAAFVRATGYETEAEQDGLSPTLNPRDGKSQTSDGVDWQHPSGPDSDISSKGSHPVVQVSWNDAQAFIDWLSQKEGVKYSLPTEAQWEYASRGGRGGELYSWGHDMPPRGQVGNFCDETAREKYPKVNYYIKGYKDGYAETAPVGNYQSNGFRLHDMIGNVWEWCKDWHDTYSYGSRTDPKGPNSGELKVLRGGGWKSTGSLRSARRIGMEPYVRYCYFGFRLVRNNPCTLYSACFALQLTNRLIIK